MADKDDTKPVIRTSAAGWLKRVAEAYKARQAFLLEDDAHIGVDPREDTLLRVLRETVRRARAAGLGQLGLVTIDGTKVRANTSRHKAMSHGRMVAEEARLERECAAIVARMEEVNAAEDTEHGEDDDGSGGLPAELQSRERRRATLRPVRAQLAQEKGEQLEPRHQKSFADPDAQMMRTGDGAH